jgi:hypothetical protein
MVRTRLRVEGFVRPSKHERPERPQINEREGGGMSSRHQRRHALVFACNPNQKRIDLRPARCAPRLSADGGGRPAELRVLRCLRSNARANLRASQIRARGEAARNSAVRPSGSAFVSQQLAAKCLPDAKCTCRYYAHRSSAPVCRAYSYARSAVSPSCANTWAPMLAARRSRRGGSAGAPESVRRRAGRHSSGAVRLFPSCVHRRAWCCHRRFLVEGPRTALASRP